MNVLKRWMSIATPAEKKALAHRAGTTIGTLQQLAGGYRTGGKLRVSADFAARLERATAAHKQFDLRLYRTTLCPTCARCEYAQKCGG